MRRIVVAALILVSAGCTGRTVQSPLAVSHAALDSIAERGRNEIGLPGVSVVIMHGRTIVLARGYGVADREAGAAATPETIYAIGSLSKQFTAAAIMKLVEESRIRLEEPVSTYLPDYLPGRMPVPTIRNLLLQNSGLPEWDGLPEMQDIDTGDPTRFELPRMVGVIARQPPLYRAGDWWSYSNSNYTVLAAVIERVTGKSYDEYLASTLFEPLGLTSTGGCASARVPSGSQRAVGYQDKNSYALRPLSRIKARSNTGTGGLCSSAVDLAMWMRALVDGKAVTRGSLRAMTTAAPVRAGFTPPYGFGLSLLPLAGQEAVWHAGVTAGYTAVLAYLPGRDLIISSVANARYARLQSIVKDFVRELLRLPEPRLHDLPIDRSQAERVTGNYDDGMFKFRISTTGAQLFLDVPEFGTPKRLLHQGDGEFATARPDDIRLRFEPAIGAVQRIVWEWGELRAYGRRVP